ncbi:MAG: tetratricopeptide repeat protein [Armatimonadota bacterium]
MSLTGQNPADKSVPGVPPSLDRDAGEVTREMSIGPLLARANLLRMRGQWNEAIAVCTEALRLAPRSPTAHSVLGDIYEAQGKYDDALQWYGMAVDLAPNRAADREKLERVVAIQRGRLREMDKERTADMDAHRARVAGKLTKFSASPTSGTGGRAAAERTVEWFDRVFPPGRSESIARLIFALCGIIAVLIASAAVFVYTSSSRAHKSTSQLAEGGTNASGLPMIAAPSTPVRVNVPADASPASRVPAAVKASPAPLPSASTAPTPSPGTPQTIFAQLSQSLPPGLAVTALLGTGEQSSPYQMEIALPRAPQETPASTQERFIRAAALAARTLALLDSRAFQVTVRASLRDGVIQNNSSSAPPVDIPVFQGSVLATLIREVDPTITPTAALQSRFSSVSWGVLPSLSSANPQVQANPAAGSVPPAATLAAPSSP